MTGIPVPYEVQRRAWEAAFVLRQEFADRITLEQNIRMEVILRVAPFRLGWAECGDALATLTLAVMART